MNTGVLNTAIETCVGSFFSLDDRARCQARFGPDVTAQVKAIHDDCMACPGVDWKTATIDSALPILAAHMATRYPWLSDPARRILVGCFVMCWK